MFKAADTRGQTKPPVSGAGAGAGAIPVGSDGMLLTVHQNSITSVEPYEWNASGEVVKVSTVGKDGRLVLWPVSGKAPGGVAGRMANLQM